jgi:Cohesin domain
LETKKKLALYFLVCLMTFTAARPVGAATARLTLEPSQVEDVATGATFSINVNIADVSDLYGWQINMTFNPQVLNVESVTEGSFLNQLNETIFIKKIENSGGFLGASAIFNVPYPEHGASGSGLLCTITFVVMSGGSSVIKFNTVGTKLNTIIGGNRVSITDFTTTDGAFGNPDSGGLGGFPLEYVLIIVVVVVVAVATAFFLLRRRNK